MKETVAKGVLWNEAAKAGLVLGLVPVVYLFLNQLASGGISNAILSGVVNFLLWAIKFYLCIWLMVRYMRKFAANFYANNSETFKFGIIVALCSSIIVAAVSLANVLIINPNLMANELDTMVESYGSMLDANTLQSIDRIKEIMPQLTFFSNLIYCFLFGLILSYILSRNIPPRNLLFSLINEMKRTGRLKEDGSPANPEDQDAKVENGNQDMTDSNGNYSDRDENK